MSDDFKVGDTVTLASGGPLMTIARIEANEERTQEAHCVWFDKNEQQGKGTYPLSTIRKGEAGSMIV